MQLRGYQEQFHNAIKSTLEEGTNRQLAVLPTASGKCLAKGTPVLLYDGNVVPVEEVQVGDLLMGPDSTPRTVLSLAHGEEEMYAVVPKKGDSYTVNKSHILSLKMTNGSSGTCGKHRSGDTVDISIEEYLQETKTFRHCAKGYRVAVDFPDKPLPLDPYILGVWLGDGNSRNAAITNIDPEIVDAWTSYAQHHDMNIRIDGPPERAPTYHMVGKTHGVNEVLSILRSLNVLLNKHIPHEYKANSRRHRLELLAGLIDTDGSLSRCGFDFIQKRESLARDTVFLARSLGLAAYIKRCKKSCQNGFVGEYWRVSISGNTNIIPCRVARKKAGNRLQKKDVLSVGIQVEPVGVGEYFGFEIDGNRRFLLGDFTVTHNTVCVATLPEVLQHKSMLFLAHRDELIQQAAQKLKYFNPDVSIGIEKADFSATEKDDFVVASVPTLGRKSSEKRLHRFAPDRFDMVVVDECFPPGTLVDGLPIESYSAGQMVWSANVRTGMLQKRPIKTIFRSKPSALLYIRTDLGEVFCTPNHPFYLPREKKWVNAIDVSCDMVLCTMRVGIPNVLQSGYCQSHAEDSGGGRRFQSLLTGEAQPGSEETSILTETRVERVEVYKPGSPKFIQFMCGQDFVYNLEIETDDDDERTYFANGFLVHNCHHSTSKSYLQILRHFKPKLLLGITATPMRGDGTPLANVYDKISFIRTIPQLITEGEADTALGPYLSRIRGLRVKSSTDLRNIHIRAGDFAEGELASAVNIDARNSMIISAIEQHLEDRKSILMFAVDKAHVETLCQQLKDRGHLAEFVVDHTKSTDRAERIKAFKEGNVRIMVNCGIFTEGTDIPNIDAVVMARPVLSPVLYLQMIGRSMRVCPGKEYAIVMDVVDTVGKLNVQTIGDAFGVRGCDFLGEDVFEKAKIVQRAQELGVQVNIDDTIEIVERKADTIEKVVKGTISVETRAQLIDVLSISQLADEVTTDSIFPWVKINESLYVLPMPDKTVAELTCDPLGMWKMKKGDINCELETPRTSAPFKWSDKIVKKLYEYKTWKMKCIDAKWRQVAATPKQIAALRNAYRVQIIPENFTKGSASDLFDSFSAIKKYMARGLAS